MSLSASAPSTAPTKPHDQWMSVDAPVAASVEEINAAASSLGNQVYARDYSSFFWTALAWAILGLFACIAIGPSPLEASKWMIGLWLLSVADLFTLAQALRYILSLTGFQGPASARAPLILKIVYWSLAKLTCLGLFGVVLWVSKNIPLVAVITGLATLVVVPLIGGLVWSQKEFGHARRA